jgi:hypothetical protein
VQKVAKFQTWTKPNDLNIIEIENSKAKSKLDKNLGAKYNFCLFRTIKPSNNQNVHWFIIYNVIASQSNLGLLSNYTKLWKTKTKTKWTQLFLKVSKGVFGIAIS